MADSARITPTSDETAPRWASVDNAARYFDLSIRTIQRLAQRGVIPARSFPGVRSKLIDLDAAERVLKADAA